VGDTSSQTERFPLKPVPIVAGLFLFFLLLFLPAPEGLSVEGWRVVAVASLMIVWWITEAIPVPATALIPVALFPMTGATSGSEATSPYGDPIIFLFMGGFILALAMERWNLHRRIALNIVARTGTQQGRIVAGFMLATAFVSMWVSNTATVVMMLPVALSVVGLLEDKGDGQKSTFPLALLLGVAYAASIGGVATLIGTPPNALLAGALNQTYGYDIGFGRWMIIGLPVAILMLAIAWLFLTKVTIRLDKGEVAGAAELFRSEIAKLGSWSVPEIRVAVVFLGMRLEGEVWKPFKTSKEEAAEPTIGELFDNPPPGRKYSPIPERFWGFPVVDGDVSDLRSLDIPSPCIVALRFKTPFGQEINPDDESFAFATKAYVVKDKIVRLSRNPSGKREKRTERVEYLIAGLPSRMTGFQYDPRTRDDDGAALLEAQAALAKPIWIDAAGQLGAGS